MVGGGVIGRVFGFFMCVFRGLLFVFLYLLSVYFLVLVRFLFVVLIKCFIMKIFERFYKEWERYDVYLRINV